ncbi:hypothetical protein GGH95_004066, partial [Coemansia sp. RSA 1836]
HWRACNWRQWACVQLCARAGTAAPRPGRSAEPLGWKLQPAAAGSRAVPQDRLGHALRASARAVPI